MLSFTEAMLAVLLEQPRRPRERHGSVQAWTYTTTSTDEKGDRELW